MAKRKQSRNGTNIGAVSQARKLRLKHKKAKRESERFRTTTHKARSEWFRAKAAWPFRDAPVQLLVGERARVKQTLAPIAVASAWELVGPTNVGGRMTCVASHPTNADIIWAGAAGGGVWQSLDAGKTWKPLWHKQDSLNVGALAIDFKDPNVIYCGTGEADLSADSYPGVGIYKSVDGGKNWNLIADSKTAGVPARVGAIAVDPFDSIHIFVGGVGHNYPGESHLNGLAGLFESKDSGGTWRRLDFISSLEYRCHAIVFHPTKEKTVYATISEQGSKNGIWRSLDGGQTWTHLTKGLPGADQFDRTSLAIAPSKPSVLYALAADSKSKVLGVFRTTNGGNTWTSIHGKNFSYKRKIGSFTSEYEVQMTYNNTIAVHPTNPNHVLCGGVDLHLTTDGGKTWKLVTKWDSKRGNADYAHADHHALLMPGAKPGRVYDMNDGGMDVSEDGGKTWANRSNGLAATMYYDLDVAQSNSKYFGGGAQDNGTLLTTTGKADDHFDVTGGDGGFMAFDPKNENHIYTSVYNMQIFRFPPTSGQGFEDVSPNNTDPGEADSVWMVFLAMDPANSKVVFTGSSRVWRTKDDGKTWKPVSPYFDSTISAIEIARADSKRIYIGTESGAIHRSLDGGDTWSGDLSSATVPNFKITRIETSPVNADQLIVTIGNFGNSHVFRSLDGGKNWSNIDNGQLPGVPHNSIAIPTKFPREVYLATDAGVYFSPDFGDTWKDLTGDLPNVSIVDVVYQDMDNTLTAATYGRSVWRIKIR